MPNSANPFPRSAPVSPVRLIDAAGLARCLTVSDYAGAAERAFRLYGTEAVSVPAPLHLAGNGGGVHVKAAALAGGRRLLVLKLNANFPENPRRTGRPTIQGLIAVFDGDDGSPLALLDSAEITAQRTAAAAALAARLLARPGATNATLVGCGAQGPSLLLHLLGALPGLRRISLFDREPERAARLQRRFRRRIGAELSVAKRLDQATRDSAVIVTCTPAREPFLARDHLAKGTFVAAMGADHPDKRELCGDLLAAATLVVDSRAQCGAMGEWHHVAGDAAPTAPAELGEILRGQREGRRHDEEVIVFDSTGMAVQDACAIEVALGKIDRGRAFRFAAGHS